MDKKSLKKSLKECVTIKDRDEFTDSAFSILKPYYKLVEQLPETGEEENSKQIQINDVLKYEIKGNLIDLHLPETGAEFFRLTELFKKGFKEIAKLIKDNENITEISMDSWIVKDYPKRVKQEIGFKVKEGEVTPWSKTATMSKEDFLKRYLEKER